MKVLFNRCKIELEFSNLASIKANLDTLIESIHLVRACRKVEGSPVKE